MMRKAGNGYFHKGRKRIFRELQKEHFEKEREGERDRDFLRRSE